MKHLEDNGVVTLTKLRSLQPVNHERKSTDIAVAILDVETTGFDSESDELIQIALRPVLVDLETGNLTAIKKPLIYQQQPSQPLSERIKQVTNFSDEDLDGESVNWSMVGKVLGMCHFVVAHNARFDRPWVERYLRENDVEINEDLIWACSMSQVDWDRDVVPSKSLEVLCAWNGFFYNSHSAESDIDATLHLLRKTDSLKELLTNASSPDWHVFATNTLRQENEKLKKRRYRWNPELTCWWKATPTKEEAESESAWLSENMSRVEPQIFEIEAKHRFEL